MLVNSVIIVLREVLEAALMISVMLSLSRWLALNLRWLGVAMVLGFAGAIAYARNLVLVSDLFDGVGQEILNASLQAGVFAAVAVVVFLVAGRRRHSSERTGALPAAMATAVALAVAQEGSEIIIYVSGFVAMNDFFSSVGVGSLAGAGIGMSVGVLFYYVLLAIPERRAFLIALMLLGLVAASMCIQAVKLLAQADWLSVGGPLWDSSWLVAENSVPGQLLYALIGYEATPSAIEVSAYTGSLAIIAISALLGWAALSNRGLQSK